MLYNTLLLLTWLFVVVFTDFNTRLLCISEVYLCDVNTVPLLITLSRHLASLTNGHLACTLCMWIGPASADISSPGVTDDGHLACTLCSLVGSVCVHHTEVHCRTGIHSDTRSAPLFHTNFSLIPRIWCRTSIYSHAPTVVTVCEWYNIYDTQKWSLVQCSTQILSLFMPFACTFSKRTQMFPLHNKYI